MSLPFRFFRQICFIVGFVVLFISLTAGAGVLLFLGTISHPEKMKFQDLKNMAQNRIKLKLQNKSLRPQWIDIEKINRDYLFSIVMSEDSTYFEHGAVSYSAIVQAFLLNLKHQKYESGASTITQQVAKNLFLTDEKTLSRKLREMVLAERLEKAFTKNKILELYLNMAEFGPDIFGIDAASKYFFHKSPDKINVPEGIFIALMLPSPRKTHYTLFENQNLSLQKKNKIRRILGDMLVHELISPKQYREYQNYRYFSH